jgi:hypothetical protein
VLPLSCWLLQRCPRRLMFLPQAVNQPKFNQQRRDAQGCDAVSFARTLSFLHPTSAASTLTCQNLLAAGPCWAPLLIAGPPCLPAQVGCSSPAAHGLQPCSQRCSCVPLRTCSTIQGMSTGLGGLRLSTSAKVAIMHAVSEGRSLHT